jgi:hypothetical protein
MPRGDRTGPMGVGSRTGRGLGYCNADATPGLANQPIVRRGWFGFGGRGGGCGWRHRFFATGIPSWAALTPEQEAADLNAQTEWLKAQLNAIQKRIDEITLK